MSSCHLCLINLFVIWAFLSFGGFFITCVFLSFGSCCHLGFLATWVFLPFGSSCYLDLLVILVFLLFGSSCHFGLLGIWVLLPFRSSCHLGLLVTLIFLPFGSWCMGPYVTYTFFCLAFVWVSVSWSSHHFGLHVIYFSKNYNLPFSLLYSKPFLIFNPS